MFKNDKVAWHEALILAGLILVAGSAAVEWYVEPDVYHPLSVIEFGLANGIGATYVVSGLAIWAVSGALSRLARAV